VALDARRAETVAHILGAFRRGEGRNLHHEVAGRDGLGLLARGRRIAFQQGTDAGGFGIAVRRRAWAGWLWLGRFFGRFFGRLFRGSGRRLGRGRRRNGFRLLLRDGRRAAGWRRRFVGGFSGRRFRLGRRR